jgi:hypothetical protein
VSAPRLVALLLLAACGPGDPGPARAVAPMGAPAPSTSAEHGPGALATDGAQRAVSEGATPGASATDAAQPAGGALGLLDETAAVPADPPQGGDAPPSVGSAPPPRAEPIAAPGSSGPSTGALGATTNLSARCEGLTEPACRGHRACLWIDTSCAPRAPRR